jgi:dTDP-L-rhamnose 4-epimerase
VSKTLVTGGAGFIGSHLVDLLVERGDDVRVLDNLDPLAHAGGRVPDHLAAEAELIVGDLRDREAVDRALDGVATVFHLGGVVGNGESMVNVRRAVDNNSGGTATLLEAIIARRDRMRRVVAASSMVVYGDGAYDCPVHGRVPAPPRTPAALAGSRWEPRCGRCDQELSPAPTAEDAPLRPTSVYGITKRDQEELVLTLGQAYGIETVALRYLNVYGPRQALANPYTGVAAIFAARLLHGRRPTVFEDGGQIRDLVHVSDVARATAAAMTAPDAPGQAINVATGRRVTVAELAEQLAAALDSPLEPDITGSFRAGDIRHCFADTTRARGLLGFEAAVRLEAGLPELADWVSSQEALEHGDDALADLTARGLVTTRPLRGSRRA